MTVVLAFPWPTLRIMSMLPDFKAKPKGRMRALTSGTPATQMADMGKGKKRFKQTNTGGISHLNIADLLS